MAQFVFFVASLTIAYTIYYILFHTLSTVLPKEVSKLMIVTALYGGAGYGAGVLFFGTGIVLGSVGALLGAFLGYAAYIK